MAFIDKMKEYLDKGVEVSKEALSKAGDAVQDFSDKSVTKIETHQLVSRQNKEYRALGQAVCRFFEDNPSGSLTADDSCIVGIIQEINRLDKEIVRREESLKARVKSDKSEESDAADSQAREAVDAAGTADAADAEFTKGE